MIFTFKSRVHAVIIYQLNHLIDRKWWENQIEYTIRRFLIEHSWVATNELFSRLYTVSSDKTFCLFYPWKIFVKSVYGMVDYRSYLIY